MVIGVLPLYKCPWRLIRNDTLSKSNKKSGQKICLAASRCTMAEYFYDCVFVSKQLVFAWYSIY